MRLLGVVCLLMSMASCAARAPVFRVVKPGQEFALESPVRKKKTVEAIPFSKLMERQYGFTPGRGYVDLLPGMRVSATRAYFSGTAVTLNEYLGAETGEWTIEPGPRFRFAGSTPEPGLRKPATEPSIEKLLDPAKRKMRVYRMFFQVRWFTGGRDDARGSVILGAPDAASLEAATKILLAEKMPECGARLDCIPFPGSTTVTSEIGIDVNGERRWLPWGTTVRSTAPPSSRETLRVERRWGKSLAPVEFTRDNDEAWRFPLLPGDSLHWAATSSTAATERVVTSADGVSAPVAFDTRGKGETAIVFIHGWAADRTYWREQVDVFARGYQVVTLDLTGHGPFAPAAPPRAVLALSSDVEAVVRDLSLRRVILVGHSMGAAVALNAAKRLRGIVRGVVLVSPDVPSVNAADLATDFKGAMEKLIRSQFDGPHKALAWILERAAKADSKTALSLLQNFATLDVAKLQAEASVPVEALTIDSAGYFPQLRQPAGFNEKLRVILSAFK